MRRCGGGLLNSLPPLRASCCRLAEFLALNWLSVVSEVKEQQDLYRKVPNCGEIGFSGGIVRKVSLPFSSEPQGGDESIFKEGITPKSKLQHAKLCT